MYNNKNIYILGGGVYQQPLISTAISLFSPENVHVISPEYYKCEKHPDNASANWYKADAKDIASITEYINKSKRDKIIITDCELLRTVANKLSQNLGCYSEDTNSLELFINKKKMADHAANCRYYETIPTFELPSDNWKKFISKPRIGTGSYNISIHPEKPLPVETDNYIFQPIIEGIEITLEGICINGKHSTLTSSIKYECKEFGVHDFIKYPADINESRLQSVIEKNNMYVESTGIKNTITHIEWLLTDNGDYLMDAAARGGMAVPGVVIKNMFDIDLYKLYIESIMTGKAELNYDIPSLQCAAWFPNLSKYKNSIPKLKKILDNHNNIANNVIFIDNIKRYTSIDNKYMRHGCLHVCCTMQENIFDIRDEILYNIDTSINGK